MKHQLLSIGMAVSLLFSFSSCTGTQPDAEEPSAQPESTAQQAAPHELIPIKADYWQLVAQNTDVVLYANMTGINGLEFQLFSAFQFDPEELVGELEFDHTAIPYQIECGENLLEKDENENGQGVLEIFPFYIYQCYRQMDWRPLGELETRLSESDHNDLSVMLELDNLRNTYLDEYQIALEQEQLPQLYGYSVGINFDQQNSEAIAQVKAINLTLRGETKRYALDRLVLDAETTLDFDETDICTTIARFGPGSDISNEGRLTLGSFNFESEEPFTLTGLSLFKDDGATITECWATLTQGDQTPTTMKWDLKTPIQVLSGETLTLEVFAEQPGLGGEMEATLSKYLMIDYKLKNGKKHTELVQGIYYIHPALYDLYALEDGANVLSFYLDYQAVSAGRTETEQQDGA